VRRVRHVASVGERKDAYMVWVRISEGKKSLGKPRHRWEDNIILKN
jgi:hypothetical protein